jgi:NRAMP (natural resistance-associated macrophage protein)-like metal ion transporter
LEEALLQRTRLLGPAFVAAVAYVDPGNVATNTQAGAGFGYLLLWVLVGATLMAGLVQYLSAKVGWLTGETLPAPVARRNSPLARVCYCIQAELVAVATDLAEMSAARSHSTLVRIASDRDLMHLVPTRRATIGVAWSVIGTVTALNVILIVLTAAGR